MMYLDGGGAEGVQSSLTVFGSSEVLFEKWSLFVTTYSVSIFFS